MAPTTGSLASSDSTAADQVAFTPQACRSSILSLAVNFCLIMTTDAEDILKRISISEICSFTSATPSSRNFIEGERLVNAGHILNVGKSSEDQSKLHLIGFCLQTSNLKEKPHEIKVRFMNNGKVLSATCTCKAGLSQKCKHVVALLIYCNRNDITHLSAISCTDQKCSWKTSQAQSLEKYMPAPLNQHKCFQIQQNRNKNKNNDCAISEEQQKLIKQILYSPDSQSALTKHASGRHDPVLPPINLDPAMCETAHLIEAIFQNQSCTLLQKLSEVPFQPLRECCQEFVSCLSKDVITVYKETLASHIAWQNERQFRITGSRCYQIFTYCYNKNPDWDKKAMNYFYPSKFTNKFVQHGLKYEGHARIKYEEITSQRVLQCGLITSQQNNWLGYSPDGVVFNKNNPDKLLEIKCPFEGKKDNIYNVVKNLKYLEKDCANNLTLKKKHMYYAQVQMGMAVLNLRKTDFVLYASYDNSIIIITVDFDEAHATEMLSSIKYAYFNNMIHYVCTSKNT